MSIEIPDGDTPAGLEALAAPPKRCPECGSDRPKQRANWNGDKMSWCMSAWHKGTIRAKVKAHPRAGVLPHASAGYDALRLTEEDEGFLQACGIGVR